MRVLIVHNILWAHYKSSVFQALQQLVDQRPDVSLKVLQIARNERSRAGLEALPASSQPSYRYTYELLFDTYIEEVTVSQRTVALLQRTRAYQPDVLVLTGYYDLAQQLLLFWAKLRGIRVIMQNESTVADRFRTGWKELVKTFIVNRFDGFFCFGSQSANYLIQLGVRPDQILLRKSAVDNALIRAIYDRSLASRIQRQVALRLRPKNFVFVGRLISEKNIPTLIDAFVKSQAQSTEAREWGLILLGDGPEQTNLTEQIHNHRLAESIKMLPGRPWFEVPEILALADVLVLPSHSEPWGLVVNEAMACGLPVIVSDRCGCVPDLVTTRETGFVFNPNDPVELANHMQVFIQQEVNLVTMQQAIQKRIAAYTPEALAQEMFEGFNTVMRN